MQIVRLVGGIGNQMFLYAFARALGDNVMLSKQSYKTDNLRHMMLDVFNIKLKFATASDVKKFRRWHWIQKMHLPCMYVRVSEPDCLYHPEAIKHRKNVYYTGYWQCEKYFKHIRAELLKDFTLCVPLDAENQKMLNRISAVNAVSLHVRRGDYVNLQNSFCLCSQEYYNNAIEYIKQNVDNPHFFVFSDDMGWVQDNLNLDCNHTFVNINDGEHGYFDEELST